jgi:AcrR family transcriptional regulator
MSIAVDKATRNSHAEFLDAGISLIAKQGIDNITVADISKASGFTRATFYSYFGDLDGLYAEIWMLYGRPWLEALAKDNLPYKSEADQLRCFAVLEIFISSKRKPAVLEVVTPTVANWWNDSATENKADQAKLAWIVAGNIGIAISKHLSPSIAQVSEIIALLRQMPSDETVLEAMGLAPAPKTAPLQAVLRSLEVPEQTDEERIKTSTIEVVASAGVADASMTRIARNLQVTTGSVYPRFKNVSEIIGEAFNWGQKKIVEENTAAYATTNSNPDSYAAIIVGANAESRKVWRDFRLEMYLASRSRESLSKAMRPGLVEADNLLATFASRNGLPERHIDQIVGLMHALGLGFPALQNAGVDVAAIEHRIPTRYLVSVMNILKSSGVAASEFRHSIAQDAVMSAFGNKRALSSAAAS